MPLYLNGTDGVYGVNGTNTTPANRGSDTNTGIVYGTDTVQIATGGTTAVTVDSSQNVGIGTASPSQKLQIYGNLLCDNASATNIYVQSAGTTYTQFQTTSSATTLKTVPANPLIFGTSDTERARIDSSGNVGIGTTSPQARFHSKAGATSQAGIFEAANSVALLSFVGSSTSSYTRVQIGADVNDMVFYTTGSERARIDSSGNLLVGTTNSSDTVGAGIKLLPGGYAYAVSGSSTSGASCWNMYSTGASAYRFYVNYAGTIFATSTTITGISDRRLKENIADIDVGLDALLALKPRKFDWKTGKGKDIKGDRGWIADEFQQVFPDLIEEWKDTPPEGEEPYKAVRADLVPVLVKAIQELSAKLDAAEARIAALEAK